jgi:hypothetical protein
MQQKQLNKLIERFTFLLLAQRYQEVYSRLRTTEDPQLILFRARALINLGKNREAIKDLFLLLKKEHFDVFSLLLPLLVKLNRRDKAEELTVFYADKFSESKNIYWKHLISKSEKDYVEARRLLRLSIEKKQEEYGSGFSDLSIGEKASYFSPIVFTGGAPQIFETVGRKTLSLLVERGLQANHKLLDIGCGCLRCGIWIIPFLEEECYFGIEPNIEMMRFGTDVLLQPSLLEQKKPHFDHNSDFDFSVFQQKFDFFVARSIWTHASRKQIEVCLDNFVKSRNKNGKMLVSYIPPVGLNTAYLDHEWLGISHLSNDEGYAYHKLEWIEAVCQKRGLDVLSLQGHTFNLQHWLEIS